MTYLADEQSVEDGRPREGYLFEIPAQTWRLASGDRDIVIGGATFHKSQVSRGPLQLSQSHSAEELEVMLPVDHAIPQRWTRQGIPPSFLRVTVYRVQLRSGEYEPQWQGLVTAMSIDGDLAKFLVSSRLGEAMQRRIPTITAGRGCPHILYGDACRANRLSNTIITTVQSHSGAEVTLQSDGGKPDQWFQYGELIHIPTGERVTIFDHTGNVVTLQFPVVDMAAGDTVAVAAGCAHDIGTCVSKFGNQANYGGAPQMPAVNPMRPGTNLGVIQS